MTCIIGGQLSSLNFEIIGYGVEAEKLKRRLTCALGGLGWQAQIRVHADTERAIALGATRDPVLLVDGALFVQGLLRTEELEALLVGRLGRASETAGTVSGQGARLA